MLFAPRSSLLPLGSASPDPDHPLVQALEHLWVPARAGYPRDVIGGLHSVGSPNIRYGSPVTGLPYTATTNNDLTNLTATKNAYPAVLFGCGFTSTRNGWFYISALGSGSTIYLNHGGTGTIGLTARRNFGTQRALLTTGTVAANVTTCVLAQLFSDTDYRLYANGEQVNGTLSFGTGGTWITGIEPVGGQGQGGIYLSGAGWGKGSISDELALRITRNPLHELPRIFRQRRIIIPVGAASLPPHLTLSSGSLTQRPAPSASDSKLYLASSGTLVARQSPQAGDRRVTLESTGLVAYTT